VARVARPQDGHLRVRASQAVAAVLAPCRACTWKRTRRVGALLRLRVATASEARGVPLLDASRRSTRPAAGPAPSLDTCCPWRPGSPPAASAAGRDRTLGKGAVLRHRAGSWQGATGGRGPFHVKHRPDGNHSHLTSMAAAAPRAPRHPHSDGPPDGDKAVQMGRLKRAVGPMIDQLADGPAAWRR
jgi:hypothetical protein